MRNIIGIGPHAAYGAKSPWRVGIDRYNAAGHPGYRRMMEWSRGKCFSNFAAARAAFHKAEDY